MHGVLEDYYLLSISKQPHTDLLINFKHSKTSRIIYTHSLV